MSLQSGRILSSPLLTNPPPPPLRSPQLASRLSGLTSLSLRRLGPLVSAAPLLRLAEGSAATLRRLTLASLPALGDAPLVALASLARSGRTELLTVDISFSRGVGDDALGALVDASPRLARLVCWGCTQLTPRFFDGHRRAAAVCGEAEAAAGVCHACLERRRARGGVAAAGGGGGGGGADGDVADCVCGWAPLAVHGRPGDVMPEPAFDDAQYDAAAW